MDDVSDSPESSLDQPLPCGQAVEPDPCVGARWTQGYEWVEAVRERRTVGQPGHPRVLFGSVNGDIDPVLTSLFGEQRMCDGDNLVRATLDQPAAEGLCGTIGVSAGHHDDARPSYVDSRRLPTSIGDHRVVEG
jgi:hypothetical protein